MKDFKSLPKMKTGGRVKKYEEGGEVTNKTQDASRQRMQEKNARLAQEGKLSLLDQNSEWVKQNYPEFDKALTKAVAQDGGKAPKGARVGGGGAGYVPGSNNPFNPDSPLNRKKGGRVTKKVGTVKKNK